jgi:hypothetical protein
MIFYMELHHTQTYKVYIIFPYVVFNKDVANICDYVGKILNSWNSYWSKVRTKTDN